MQDSPSFEEFDLSDPVSIQIGKGTFGIVKVAKSRKNGKKYAFKIVDTKKLVKDDLFCVEREIEIHSRLRHPNIIRLYDYRMEKEQLVMMLEYAPNGNLFGYIRKKKRLSEMEAFKLFYQTAQALKYLHQNDILHRDIKPENLLLDENNNIKLCDFGWSTQGISVVRNTFCGTYEYMSPEIVFKKAYTENIDIWASGILLYEMVHGKSPYRAKSLKEISEKIVNDNKLLFSEDVSPDLANLISSILKINPSERLDLNGIFNHPWVKKMYTFVNYKESFEDSNEDKMTSTSLKSEKQSNKIEKIPEKIASKKAMPYDSQAILTESQRPKEFDFEKVKEKIKSRRQNRIFESLHNSDCPQILREMANLMQDLNISSKSQRRKEPFLL